MLLFSALKKERVKDSVYLPVFASCFAFFAAFFFFSDGIILPCSSDGLSLKDFSIERANIWTCLLKNKSAHTEASYFIRIDCVDSGS